MAKTKVSVTIERSVLERVDRASKGKSRSEVVEPALRHWLNEGRRLELDEEIARYYCERREDELAEDRSWAALSAKQIGKTWDFAFDWDSTRLII
ncbi:MAG TPA: ribbon-helix-helix protein, CopG family [Vicinamibacteria bacterium]|nr:ribbon-helix-helix protein, CopG family [Vicinamibacteria bacterium]